MKISKTKQNLDLQQLSPVEGLSGKQTLTVTRATQVWLEPGESLSCMFESITATVIELESALRPEDGWLGLPWWSSG